MTQNRIRAALAALLLLLTAGAALAQQFPQTLPANTVYGRLGIGPGPGQAIPIARLSDNNGIPLARQMLVSFEGDSLSIGGTWTTYLTSRSGFFARAKATNFAAGGALASAMVGQYASEAGAVGHKPAAAGDEAYFSLFAGVNDLTASDTAVNIYANLKILWADARADGYKVIAFTIHANLFHTGAKETQRAALNVLIRSDPTLYDFLATPDLWFPTPTDATVFTDGLHFTTAGYQALARRVALLVSGEGTIGVNSAPPSVVGVPVISSNINALPDPVANTELQIAGANGANSRISIDSFGGFGVLDFRRANGTVAAKTAVQSGDLLGGWGAGGYGATTYSGTSGASVSAYAAENWTDAAYGGELRFGTTANGTTTQVNRLTIANDGTASFLSTDAGATVGPVVSLYRNSPSPAALDVLGAASYYGNNSLGANQFALYANAYAGIVTTTSGSEDGYYALQTRVAGTTADRAIVFRGVQIGSPTGGDKGLGTLNATTLYEGGTALSGLYQGLDSDLTAVAGLSSTGLIARTGTGTAAVRTLTAPAAGITVSNGDGVSGNPTLALANDLAALEGLSGTGIARRTGTDTWTVGTTTTVAEGGTGITSGTSGGIPYYSSTSAIASSGLLTQFGIVYGGGAGASPVATAAGTDGQIPVGQTSAALLWKTMSGDCTLAAAGAITCTKVNGVTHPSSMTSGGVLYASSTSAVASSALLAANQIVLGGGAATAPATLGSLGTTTTLLHGNAAGAPTFAAVSLTADVSGTLPVANGGTGDTGTAYTAYTPSLSCTTGSLSSGSATGRYKQIGKTYVVQAAITITTIGTCSYVKFTLPNSATAAAEYDLLGRDTSNGVSILANTATGTTTATMNKYDATDPQIAGHVYNVSGVFEAQ